MLHAEYEPENKFERHQYDLELKSLLRNYEAGIYKVELIPNDKTPGYFINLIKFVVDEYCKSRKIILDKEIQILIT
ncbi:MAG: hypothetical protein IPL54_11700 [Chitinophagaceae bacterium]|nr:hypothetical protein [Chitinophagaceae bacterium]